MEKFYANKLEFEIEQATYDLKQLKKGNQHCCLEFAIGESYRFFSVPHGHLFIIYESSVETVKHTLSRQTLSCHILSIMSASVYLCQRAQLYFIFHFRDSVNLILVLWHSLCPDLGCSTVMLTLCYLNILQRQHKSSKYKVIYFSWQHGFQEPFKCPFVSLNHCVVLHKVCVWQGTCRVFQNSTIAIETIKKQWSNYNKIKIELFFFFFTLMH